MTESAESHFDIQDIQQPADTDSAAVQSQTPHSQHHLNVWSVFTSAGSGDVAGTCLLCSETVKHSGGTQNLWQHLHCHHKEKYLELDMAMKSALNYRKGLL